MPLYAAQRHSFIYLLVCRSSKRGITYYAIFCKGDLLHNPQAAEPAHISDELENLSDNFVEGLIEHVADVEVVYVSIRVETIPFRLEIRKDGIACRFYICPIRGQSSDCMCSGDTSKQQNNVACGEYIDTAIEELRS
jgi:hypothetical protein